MPYQAETIQQNQMPKTLNGFPVKAFTISRNADRALVLVHREGNFMPWVAASWWPELGDNWMWGNYFGSWDEADAYRGHWISTHGYSADHPSPAPMTNLEAAHARRAEADAAMAARDYNAAAQEYTRAAEQFDKVTWAETRTVKGPDATAMRDAAAKACRARDMPRIKLEGRIGGFQD